MTDVSHASPHAAAQAVLAIGTGIMITLSVIVLLFDTDGWLRDALPKYLLGTLLAALSVGAVRYLNRAALLERRTWITLVAAVPGLFAAFVAFIAISLAIHPIGF